MVGSQRQYEFLHRVLEEMVWGRAMEGAEETDGGKKKAKKKSKRTKGTPSSSPLASLHYHSNHRALGTSWVESRSTALHTFSCHCCGCVFGATDVL